MSIRPMKLIAAEAAIRGTILRKALLASAFALCCSASAAPMNGIYTCANGNPGNAFDYDDIPAFFGALFSQGMAGPVTLDVYDDGGPFASKPGYALGDNVPGRSLANPLVIRAAAGEQPVITGFFAFSGYNASFVLASPSYTTISGLTFQDSPYFGY